MSSTSKSTQSASPSDHFDNPAFADEWMPSDVPDYEEDSKESDVTPPKKLNDIIQQYISFPNARVEGTISQGGVTPAEFKKIMSMHPGFPTDGAKYAMLSRLTVTKSESSDVPTRAVSGDESKTSLSPTDDADEQCTQLNVEQLDHIIRRYAAIGFVPIGAPVELRPIQTTAEPRAGPVPKQKPEQKNRMFFVARLDEQNQEFQVLHETSINWAMRYSSGLVTIDYLIKKLQSLTHKMQHIEKKRAGLRANIAECDGAA